MKKICTRMLSILLMLVLLLSCVPQLAIPARAEYENTYTNTGDQRKDIIGIALTQVGYREGSSGYTKYGQWFGHSTMEWCAAFICWCANQANVPTSVIRKNGFAYASSFGLSSFTAHERTPQPGDLFFRNTGHAGFVYYIEGDYFYTIEGNTWAGGDSHPRVMIRQRDLHSSQYTFASPNYQGSSNAGCSHSYVKGSESAHPHKECYQCSKCGYSYYTGTNKVVDGCQDCCKHNFENWKKVDDSYHSAACSICGKTDRLKHDWGSDEILQQATCKDPGLKKQTCNKCKTVRETEIPATGEHQFGQWLYSDRDRHYRICEVCETEEDGEHKLSDWKISGVNHWYECEECLGRLSIGNHQLFDGCGSACTICGLTPDAGHVFSEQWVNDTTSHWQACLHCAQIRAKADHTYSAECDETCDACGFTRQVTHNYGTQWDKDSSGHWKTCKICGKEQTPVGHNLGASATESSGQSCTVCGFEVMPVLRHIHSYRYSYDNRNHWGQCACGAAAASEGHTWQMETGKCTVCQADMPVVETAPVVCGIKLPSVLKAPWFWRVLFYATTGIVLLILLIMLITGIRRKIRRSAAAALRREFAEEDGLQIQQDEIEDHDEVHPEQELVSV